MEYVEILRVRRVLLGFGIAVIVTLTINALSFIGHHVQLDAGALPVVIPASAVIIGCAVIAYILVTCVAPGLSNENSTTAIVWTRPASRTAIAWRYVAVDLATVAIGYAVVFAAGVVLFLIFGRLSALSFDAGAWRALILGLGTCVMWYGLVLFASSRLPGRGALVAGLSWPAFLIIAAVDQAPVPWLIHDVIAALNYFNPVAYVGGHYASDGQVQSSMVLDRTLRLVLPWLIGIAATAGGVRLWSTREV